MLLMRNSLLLTFCLSALLFAYDSASDYFHAAAESYVLKGDSKHALEVLVEGLEAYPGNEQLTRLAEKIREEEEQKKQQQQNDKQNKQDQDKQDKNQEQQDNEKQDSQKNDDSQKDKQDKKDQESDKEQDKDGSDDQQPKDENGQQDSTGQQPMPQQGDEDLKKEEARRIIELYADDADSLNKPMKKARGKHHQPEKDW